MIITYYNRFFPLNHGHHNDSLIHLCETQDMQLKVCLMNKRTHSQMTKWNRTPSAPHMLSPIPFFLNLYHLVPLRLLFFPVIKAFILIFLLLRIEISSAGKAHI